MKSFRQFIAEAYDPDVQGRSQIRKQGEGGRIGPSRKKTSPEKKRTKAENFETTKRIENENPSF